MPTPTSDQGIILPALGDPADVPASMATQTGGLESRLVKRYADAADRAARNPSPANGEISFLISPGRHDVRVGGAWWEMRTLYVAKATETQVVNNSTAFVNDSHLALAVQSNARYLLSGLIVIDTGTTSDFKADWVGPAGFAMPRWFLAGLDTASNPNRGSASPSSSLSINGAGIGTFLYVPLTGVVTTAGTAGTLQFRWAQNTVEAVNTRVKTDSWIGLERVD